MKIRSAEEGLSKMVNDLPPAEFFSQLNIE
jgi:hypothetical protein